ncbi:MAG: hypothetical protein JOY64_34865 [Alphaproteobacteria bacterium]|nr:hypothetical protein [Alphaproteobacteria bacterium]MBV8412849.1 hypothetical protein [Alphaproteobacteria bacterium]
MSKSLQLLLALVLSAAPSLAGAQTAGPPAGPTVDPGTKLSFGSSVGGATLERTVNYAGPPSNRPDLGSSYFYTTPKHMLITVHVFTGGKRVPSGSSSPIITEQFANELEAIAQEIKGTGFTNLQLPSVPSSCTYGSFTFRCITYSAQTPANTRVYSKLLLTGYQGNFMKIRIDWGQSMQPSAGEADAALQAFVPALLH